MKELLFGTAGIPSSTPRRSSEEGVAQCRRLGLGAMELEFVYGVRMGERSAERVNEARVKNRVVLTAHAPYYINLNSSSPDKLRAGKARIVSAAVTADKCGAYSVTFHPGFYHSSSREAAFRVVKSGLGEVLEELKVLGVKLWVRPELTGKRSAFGDLKEVVRLSSELDKVLPCIDFAHLHARTGAWNSYEEFCKALDCLESGIGSRALKELHCHVSGIEYNSKGELNHLMLGESDFEYEALLMALRDYGCAGVVICESPDPESDALLLKRVYSSL